jgi:regulator of protease activity HflC (stomatin/prohibitin superfamily)
MDDDTFAKMVARPVRHRAYVLVELGILTEDEANAEVDKRVDAALRERTERLAAKWEAKGEHEVARFLRGPA